MAEYGLLTLSSHAFAQESERILLSNQQYNSLSLSLSLYTLVGSTLVLLHKNLKEFGGPTKNITPSLFLSLSLSIGGGLQYNMAKCGLLTLSLLCFYTRVRKNSA